MIHAYDKLYLSVAQKKSCLHAGLYGQRFKTAVGNCMAVVLYE